LSPLASSSLLGLVLVGGVELRRQSPSSLASLSSVVERSGRRGKLPAGSPQSPHQHSRPRTRRGGGGGACGHGAVAVASNTAEAAICGHVAAAAASSTTKAVANRRGAVAKSTKPAGARDPPETRRVRVRVQKSTRGSCRERVFPCSVVGFLPNPHPHPRVPSLAATSVCIKIRLR